MGLNGNRETSRCPWVTGGAPLVHDRNMTPAERTQWINDRAHAAGFDLSGVAPVNGELAASKNSAEPETFKELGYLPEWLARGYAGEMKYLHDSRRSDPRLVMEGARSLIVVALNYNASQPLSTTRSAVRSREEGRDTADESPRGWISRYAWGDDYHEVIQGKLRGLIAEMRAEFPEPFEARAYVDTGPIIERVAAKYAGLGWLAKNTCLINSRLGSWLFLGVIVTTMELEASLAAGQAPPADLCGSCTRCMDACPTQAFPEAYVLDARRCISYLTIELRSGIPEEFRPQMGAAVIGCDICQDVCPWNRKAPVTSLFAFQPREVSEAEIDASVLDDQSASTTDTRRSAAFAGARVAGETFATGIQRNFSPERGQTGQVARLGSKCLCGLGKFGSGQERGGLPACDSFAQPAGCFRGFAGCRTCEMGARTAMRRLSD